MPWAPLRLEGVPSDQSLPSLVMYSVPDFSSGAMGTSYSVKTARAASPVGRGRSLKFMSARLRPANPCEIGRQFLLMEVDDGRGIAFVPQIATGNIYALHQIRSEEHTSELQSRGHLVCRLL